jgi:hypothetical protein
MRRNRRFANLEIAVAGTLASLLLRFLTFSCHVTFEGFDEIERRWAERSSVVLACWHGRSLMLPFVYRDRQLGILNSAHRDGAIIAHVLEKLGLTVTRGSSSRRGVAGLLGLYRLMRKGVDVALVPDGPRGPAGVVKPGVIVLARDGGRPVVGLSWSASRVFRLASWDRMMVPAPFSRVVVVAARELELAPEGDNERDCRELEARLKAITRRADQAVGRAPEDC